MSSISLPAAELLALCLSTFLYGLLFALVLITTVVMSYRATDDVRRQRMKILPVSYAMLAIATMHFIVGWVRGVYAFADQKGESAFFFYMDISSPSSLLRTCCLCLQATMGDAIVIWRLFIVYGRRFRIVVPAIILVIAYIVVGCIVIAIMKRATPGTDIFHVATTWVTVYFSMTMTTNFLLSGAIALRIFLAGKPLHGSRPHWLIIFTLVESCALYSLSVVAALTAFLCGSFGQYIAVDSIVPIVGISFSLIVLQIRFHVSASQGPRLASDGQPSAGWHRSDPRPSGVELEEPKDPMRPIRMAIHISRQTDTDLHPHDDVSNSSLELDKPDAV